MFRKYNIVEFNVRKGGELTPIKAMVKSISSKGVEVITLDEPQNTITIKLEKLHLLKVIAVRPEITPELDGFEVKTYYQYATDDGNPFFAKVYFNRKLIATLIKKDPLHKMQIRGVLRADGRAIPAILQLFGVIANTMLKHGIHGLYDPLTTFFEDYIIENYENGKSFSSWVTEYKENIRDVFPQME